MLKVEEVKELFRPILESSLEGKLHESTEEVIKKIIDDYSSGEEKDSTESGNEWEEKYKELKRKYIDRFMGEDEEIKGKETEEIKEEKKEEENKRIEDTKIEDLFEEKKEEK